MKVLVVPPDRPATEADISKDDAKFLHDSVSGYFETALIEDGIMWMNEDGQRLGLLPNPVATALHQSDIIVGTVVLTGPPKNADFTEVPQSIIDRGRAIEEGVLLFESFRSRGPHI